MLGLVDHYYCLKESAEWDIVFLFVLGFTIFGPHLILNVQLFDQTAGGIAEKTV